MSKFAFINYLSKHYRAVMTDYDDGGFKFDRAKSSFWSKILKK